ncbi:hypothetical protein B0H16DRAFT_366207 [Mycena metata]|uniref:Secreted protein n=1 Tax=Mycena metata TaxID=1033252 RepID=A0AAD7HJ08_9AGAR|nr:hypothetical protein B0H16DRAFT_366207 [Mycena metata]
MPQLPDQRTNSGVFCWFLSLSFRLCRLICYSLRPSSKASAWSLGDRRWRPTHVSCEQIATLPSSVLCSVSCWPGFFCILDTGSVGNLPHRTRRNAMRKVVPQKPALLVCRVLLHFNLLERSISACPSATPAAPDTLGTRLFRQHSNTKPD